MYPLLLKPIVKDYLWGGNRLKTEFGLTCDTDIAAEGWMLSCHEDGAAIVTNGEHTDKTLVEVLDCWGNRALGKNAARFLKFPLLIKLIDAKQSLSVQVHPNDDYALKNEGEFGKTELWYVVDCDEGAELIYGFTDTVSKEEFKRRIEDHTLTEICNRVPVHAGDVFFIPAGTLHAIGGGMIIAEVQQNSNATYRVFDYGRIGTDGKPRPLHIEKALDVTVCEPPTVPYGQVGDVTIQDGYTVRTLAHNDLFSADLITLNRTMSVLCENSFVSVVCLDGGATVTWDGQYLDIKKGDSLFIPAETAVELSGTATLLYSHI